jgi:hypothetical protein
VAAKDPRQTPWLAHLAPVYRSGELPPLLANLTGTLNSRAYLEGFLSDPFWSLLYNVHLLR